MLIDDAEKVDSKDRIEGKERGRERQRITSAGPRRLTIYRRALIGVTGVQEMMVIHLRVTST